MHKKIFITSVLPGKIDKYLRSKGYSVSVHNGSEPITKNELIKKASNADGIITLLSNKIDHEVLDALVKCKVIANYAVGYNNIDVQYAKMKGIFVTNTPGVLSDATAELTISLILACSRRLIEAEKFMRDGKFKGWMPDLFLGTELKGKTVGIIGAGEIGTEVARRIKAFKTKIIYFNRSKNTIIENEIKGRKVSLDYLMKNADIISIHLPLTEETYHLINRDKLRLMKKSAIIVNVARGEVIEENYLIELLKKNKIRAAGFDVYENEPNINPELLKLQNVVLLPHIGSATKETREEMALLAARNVEAVLNGKSPITPVN
ncbi:2-hydroxyacid dehydrogenase [Melioribacter sp. OK-6-Me]|uniref:2-hydroxyacid dehydrogenase n=1 Tax=unclassified Melioribacter TaxID=2627329 RepID=UPI003EDA5360